MAVFLAYVDAVPGRPYPLVPTLEGLARRGHRVAVRCGIDEVEPPSQVARAPARAVRARRLARWRRDEWEEQG
jgi:hypothetical protein